MLKSGRRRIPQPAFLYRTSIRVFCCLFSVFILCNLRARDRLSFLLLVREVQTRNRFRGILKIACQCLCSSERKRILTFAIKLLVYTVFRFGAGIRRSNTSQENYKLTKLPALLKITVLRFWFRISRSTQEEFLDFNCTKQVFLRLKMEIKLIFSPRNLPLYHELMDYVNAELSISGPGWKCRPQNCN